MVNDYGRPSSVIIKMWRLVLVTNWIRTVTYQRKGPNSYSSMMSLSDGAGPSFTIHGNFLYPIEEFLRFTSSQRTVLIL